MLRRFLAGRPMRLAAALAGVGLARPAFAEASSIPTPEELAAAGIAPPRAWDLTGNIRGVLGYKENLLLSAIRSEDSRFAQAEGEVFWWRLPTERFEALAFANASLTRFFESDENPQEWQAFAHGEARWFLSPRFQATATAETYHLDQMFDLSATTVERLTARLGVTGSNASAAFRWQLPAGGWVELKPLAQRDRYRDGSDDNWQHVGRVSAGRDFLAGRLQLALAAQALRRDYDQRPHYTIAGRPLSGTNLRFEQHEGEIGATIAWDRDREWISATSAALTTNADNGSGYFDYRHRYLRQEVTWSRPPWKVRLTGRIGRYDYEVQTAGIGINPPKRRKDEHLAQAHVERQWTEQMRFFADYRWERSRSNDPLANYAVKTASAGVDWMF